MLERTSALSLFVKRYFYHFNPVLKWQAAGLLVLRVLVGA